MLRIKGYIVFADNLIFVFLKAEVLSLIYEKNLVSVFLMLICLVFSSPTEKLLVAWKQLYACGGLGFFSSGNGLLTGREARMHCTAEIHKFNFLAVLCYLQKSFNN